MISDFVVLTSVPLWINKICNFLAINALMVRSLVIMEELEHNPNRQGLQVCLEWLPVYDFIFLGKS